MDKPNGKLCGSSATKNGQYKSHEISSISETKTNKT